MSKFKRERVYLILTDGEVTPAIVNASASRSKLDMPSKVVNGSTYRIVECPLPCPDHVMNHKWYDLNEIDAAWTNLAPPKLFEPYSTSISALRQGVSGKVTTNAETGIGTVVIPVPSGGRYPVAGRLMHWDASAGDRITAFTIEDTDGVIPVPVRAAFAAYPVLLNRFDAAVPDANKGGFISKSGEMDIENPIPVYLSAGLYLRIQVTLATPAAKDVRVNLQWLVPT